MTDAELARVLQRIARIARPTTMRIAARALTPIVRNEISAALRESASPEGSRWRAAAVASAHPLLVASGRLSRAYVVTQTDNGIRVGNRTPYAAVHQHGARIRRRPGKHGKTRGRLGGGTRIPARPVLPPARWGHRPAERLKTAAFRAVRILLGITRR